ncbi:MAG: hypothetical protein V4498_00315 [candidate division FCPU426 bacterium]
MRLYILGFLAILCAVLYFLTGCASKHPQPLAATTYREESHKPAPAFPARPQLSDSAKAAMKADAAAKRKAAEIKTALKIAAKAQADSLRIVAHTPCPVTEIPKPKRHRARGCPVGCVRK